MCLVGVVCTQRLLTGEPLGLPVRVSTSLPFLFLNGKSGKVQAQFNKNITESKDLDLLLVFMFA